MHNLRAQRTKEPLMLSIRQDTKLHKQNLRAIQDSLDKYPNSCLLGVWGENIRIRPYLKSALQEIMAVAASKSGTWLVSDQNSPSKGILSIQFAGPISPYTILTSKNIFTPMWYILLSKRPSENFTFVVANISAIGKR